MSGYTKQALLTWLHRHQGRSIVLRARRSSFSVAGVCEGLEDLDACNTEYTVCAIRSAAAGVEISLTLHDTALSLHVLLRDPRSDEALLSLPVTLSYADAILELEEERAIAHAARRKRHQEPALSTPYRLLH